MEAGVELGGTQLAASQAWICPFTVCWFFICMFLGVRARMPFQLSASGSWQDCPSRHASTLPGPPDSPSLKPKPQTGPESILQSQG